MTGVPMEDEEGSCRGHSSEGHSHSIVLGGFELIS